MSKDFDNTHDFPPILGNICKICELNPVNITIPSCEHMFCETCLKSYLTIKITEGQVLNINCPELDCEEKIIEDFIRTFLPEYYEKFVQFSENKKKESDYNFRWCPKPECSGFDIKSDSNKLECKKCKFGFCYICSEKWHTGSCKKFYKNFNSRYKSCPQCLIVIEKASGCPEINCTNCNYRFCWLCDQSISSHNFWKCFQMSKNSSFYWTLGLIMLLFPILLFFWLSTVTLLYIYIENGAEEYKKRKSTFNFTIILGIVLSPIFLIIGLIAVLFVLPIKHLHQQYLKIKRKIAYIILFSIYAPFMFLLIFTGILIGLAVALGVIPLLGLIMLFFRLVLICF